MKHTRKKICAGLLSALLALSLLTGCGGGNQTNGDVSGSQSGGDVSESQSNGDTHRNSPGGPPEASTPPPVIGLTSDSDSHYDDDLNATVNSMETLLPGADAETRENYPELAAALDRFREDAYNTAREEYQAREEELPEFIEMGGNGDTYLYGQTSVAIRRADAKAVSLVTLYAEYVGGPHVNYSYDATNFDTVTGGEIALESLLTDEGADTLNERIGQELDELYPDFTPGQRVAEYGLEDYTFSIEPDGVTFWFNPGEIAGAGIGLLTARLYFHDDYDILDDTYGHADSSWFVELAENVYQFETVTGSYETAEVWSMVNEATKATEDEGEYVFNVETFFAFYPHGEYIILILDFGEGNKDMFVYLPDGELVQRLRRTSPGTFFYPEPPEEDDDVDGDDCDFYSASLTNPDDTRLYTYVNLFGYWEAGGSYRLGGDGFKLQQDLLYGDGYTLTFKRDFTVTRCEPDNWLDVTDEEITIPQGTEVKVVAADPEQTAAYFRVTDAGRLTGDDEELIFALSYDNGNKAPHTVNGIDENDLFDGLQYLQ